MPSLVLDGAADQRVVEAVPAAAAAVLAVGGAFEDAEAVARVEPDAERRAEDEEGDGGADGHDGRGGHGDERGQRAAREEGFPGARGHHSHGVRAEGGGRI